MNLLDKVFGKIETDDFKTGTEENFERASENQPKSNLTADTTTNQIKTFQQEANMSRERTGNNSHGSNVVNFQQMAQSRDAAGNRMKVIVIEPKGMDDAQQAANFLDEKRPVILNFEHTQSDEARRILDFISGTIYAINGEITSISANVFLCAPNNVSVTLADSDKRTGDVSWMNSNKTS